MPKKSRTMSPEAKEILTREYHDIQRCWTEELQKPNADWALLFFLHFEMEVIESRAKWLKKEAQA